MPEVPPEIAQLITKKKQRYCRFADTGQWEKFDQVALPECTYHYTDNGTLIVDKGFRYEWNSTAEFTAFFSKAFSTLQVMHRVTPGEFEFVDETGDTIEAIFGLVYYSALKKGVTETLGVTGIGGGFYVETYVRRGEDWLMSRCTMDRTYEQPSA